MATPLPASAAAIAAAKARLNRTPFGMFDLVATRMQELRQLQGVK